MRPPVKPAAAIAAIAVAVGATLSACSADSENSKNAVAIGGDFQFHSPGGQDEIFYPVPQRKPIKSFSGESVRDEADTIELGDFKGEIVVLNSWGQWCAPCRSESDDLQKVHETLQESGQGTVLGINVRDYNRTISQDFLKDNGLEYPSIYDPPFKLAAALGGVPTSVVPTTIILDKQHRPAAVFLREITAEDVLEITDKIAAEGA